MKTYVFLDTSQLNDTLVDGALGDQPVHGDLSGLTETMGTIHSLSIV
jgi:hypothetical protein